MAAIFNALWNHGAYTVGGKKPFRVRSAYTFGMPRIADGIALQSLKLEHRQHRLQNLARFGADASGPIFPYHLSNFGDSVPHLPVHYLDFADTPAEWSTRDGSRVDFDLKRRRDDLALQNLLNGSGITNHSIELYIRNTLFLARNAINLL